MRLLVLTFIGEPVAKGRPKISSFGGFARAYTPKKTRQAEADLRAQMRPQLPEGWTAMNGPITIEAVFRRRRPKSAPKRVLFPTTKPDLDNILKTYLDAMNDIVFVDDSHIISIEARKEFGEPGASITIQEMFDET